MLTVQWSLIGFRVSSDFGRPFSHPRSPESCCFSSLRFIIDARVAVERRINYRYYRLDRQLGETRFSEFPNKQLGENNGRAITFAARLFGTDRTDRVYIRGTSGSRIYPESLLKFVNVREVLYDIRRCFPASGMRKFRTRARATAPWKYPAPKAELI